MNTDENGCRDSEKVTNSYSLTLDMSPLLLYFAEFVIVIKHIFLPLIN